MELPMSLWSSLLLLGALALWNTSTTLFVFAQPGAADALQAFKHALGDPPQLRSWKGDPCSPSPWTGIQCGDNNTVLSLKLSALGLSGFLSSELEKLSSLVTLWLDGNHFYGTIPSGLGKLKNLTSLRLSGNHLSGQVPATLETLSNLKELFLDGNSLNVSWSVKLLKLQESTRPGDVDNVDSCPTCSPSLAPALVLGPDGVPQGQGGGHKSRTGAIAGAVAGAFVLVAVSIGLVSLCLMRVRHSPNATSDTASSDPSAQVDWAKGSLGEAAIAAAAEAPLAKQYAYHELDHATRGFNPANLIGRGRFGLVYKGLLEDGTIVAIKTRASAPTQEFVTEVVSLSQVRHRNVVSVLGFCQEHDHQMVVYDYLPNGSASGHLYDSNGNPTGALDFKQRVAIALGAARGLEHIHSRNPPLVHHDFKTSNVLLDSESLAAKITDFGLSRLLVTSHNAMPSANGSSSQFSDPAAVYNTYRADPKSDVYSYGVFLLELITGRQAISRGGGHPSPTIVERAWSLKESSSSMDVMLEKSLVGTENAGALLMLGLDCTAHSPDKRPTMSEVAQQVERILDKERGIVAAAEGMTVVTLGSDLFK